jgi:hypothetical protein
MMDVSLDNIQRWIWNDLLRVPPGFFNGQGEHPLRFGFWWRGPLIGTPGAAQNWLLGLFAIGMFALLLLWQRSAARTARPMRVAVAAGVGVVIPLLAAGTMGWNALVTTIMSRRIPWEVMPGSLQWWTILIAIVFAATVIVFYSSRREEAVMAMGRLACFALLLMVINGPWAWNLVLATAALLLIVDIYRREGRSQTARIVLGVLRGALVAVVLFLLNRPFFQHVTTEIKPSVVAVLIDDTESMSIHDVNPNNLVAGDTRLMAAVQLFKDNNLALVKELAKTHTLHFYKFDKTATEIGNFAGPDDAAAAYGSTADVSKSLDALEAKANSTQVISSLLATFKARRSDRLAGAIVVTDARDTPTPAAAEAYAALATHHVKVFPVSVGSDKRPRNITLQSADVLDSAFKDDIVNVKATVRAAGYEAGHAVKVKLINDVTKAALRGPDGLPVEKTIFAPDSNPIVVEMLFKPEKIGLLKIGVIAERQPGELYENDNSVEKEISILDKKITVLYVEGYPRWEYRYIKNEMIRDKTVNISCILTSADPTFAQEHTDFDARLRNAQDRLKRASGTEEKRELESEVAELEREMQDFKSFPYTQFPNTLEQLMECDVVLFGDVDPRQFTRAQLEMIGEFVSKKGGGFGMIAGPQWSPADYRNTTIDYLLPVTVANSLTGWPTKPIIDGFRPIVTRDGFESPIFRFFTEPSLNEQYIRNELQKLFWYRAGLAAKPGSVVLSEHPTDTGPDGKKAPLLVLGRFGAGRTLFSAYDETWRWRFYTGESIFDTYWTEQLRYLARGRKRGQHKIIFGPEQKIYQLGDQVRVNLQVLDTEVMNQLRDDVNIDVIDTRTNQIIRTEKMLNTKDQPDHYTVSFAAEREGSFTIKPTNGLIDNLARDADKKMEVFVPDLEFAEPAVDRDALQSIAARTGGQALSLADAKAKLPSLIESFQEIRKLGGGPNDPMYMFSDMPITLVVLVFLLTLEWVVRKVCGMV